MEMYMFVSHVDSIQATPVAMEGVQGVVKQMLIGAEEGWKDHVMRLFTLKPEGYTPRHSHPWPHINYITRGNGTLFLGGKDYPLSPGSIAYVPGGTEHQFMNTGSDTSREDFAFICIVPEAGDK